QSAMSACMLTSVGIQWLWQPARYFCQAHWYFSGISWFTSARALIMALSSTVTRSASCAIAPRPVGSGWWVVLIGVSNTSESPARWCRAGWWGLLAGVTVVGRGAGAHAGPGSVVAGCREVGGHSVEGARGRLVQRALFHAAGGL